MKFRLDASWYWKNLYLIPTINIWIFDGVYISLIFLGGHITLEVWREKNEN